MHSSLEAWLVALQSGREDDTVRWVWQDAHRALPATSRTGRPGWGLKGEVESVVNMWLYAAIPRPASPPLHHLSVRIIEQHIMCSHCTVLSRSSQCYHQQGQRFHCNVWRTRKTLDRLWRSSRNTQTPGGTDLSWIKLTYLLSFTKKRSNLCEIFAQVW